MRGLGVTIPTIDLGRFRGGGIAERAAIAAEMDAAGRHLGFLRVVDPSFPTAVVDDLTAAARAFFSLPVAEKRACAIGSEERFNGYWGVESELSGALFGSAGAFDLKEKFKISRPVDNDAHDPARPEVGWAYQPNVWPAALPSFQLAAEAFYVEMQRVGDSIMEVAAAALGLGEGWFAPALALQESTASCLWYPPVTAALPAGQMGASAHRDIGSLTLLVEASGPGLARGGLEIMDEAGAWIPAAYEPGTIMVNVGDLLRRWTNDRWTSSLHRVVSPRGAAGGRMSFGFFQKPAFATVVEALPTCTGPANPPRHPPMTAGEYMRIRMLHSVGVRENVERVLEPALMTEADPAYGRPARA
ncbi:isopenicillin N synthase family oxygenase [Elioraea sp.]|uniref:isopenicillin N synthase family dioxygenase n=1 Tax=Elioraea sp. TaxID=2185103 RepID=UPI0025B98F85|nr:2-oxoglutarate and iron-dependent oxygenase domain-containing protein [Elioraea sp.]